MTSYPCNKYEQITSSYLSSLCSDTTSCNNRNANFRATKCRSKSNKSLSDEINVSDETEKKIKSGQYSFLFGTPKTWIKQEKWYHMLTSELFPKKTLIIVAHEARLSSRVGWGKRSQMGQSKSCDIFSHEL